VGDTACGGDSLRRDSDAEAITYDLGVLPPVEDAADRILVDGELRDPHNRAEVLEIG
jgi:hypothetical protein